MTVHNPADSTRLFAFVRGAAVLENERPAMTLPTSRGPNRTHLAEGGEYGSKGH